MRIGRKPRGERLAAEVVHLRLRQPPFEERARVDAGRGVALEIYEVSRPLPFAAEEVLEADFVEARRRGVGRDVAPDTAVPLVGARDHHRRIPANDAPDAPLDAFVARVGWFGAGGDGVDVGRVEHFGNRDALRLRGFEQPVEQVARAATAACLDYRFQRLNPLARLLRVAVGQLLREVILHVRLGATLVVLKGLVVEVPRQPTRLARLLQPLVPGVGDEQRERNRDFAPHHHFLDFAVVLAPRNCLT